MGDFNDDPGNKSLKKVLGAKAKKEQGFAGYIQSYGRNFFKGHWEPGLS